MANIQLPQNKQAIFLSGLTYYLAVLLFALMHVESKFIMDGFSHVFTIANWETFSPAMGRHVLILHQLIPVVCAKLGATTMSIMEAYVLGDVLFHFSIFLCLLFILKDQWAALFAVSVHVFGMFYNHFMMVGELHPGSMFAIVTLSVVVNWRSLSNWKRVLLFPSAFFTVSSHPLALAGFLVSLWLWRLSVKRNVGLGYVGVIVTSILMLILKWLLLDSYDVDTVTQIIRPFSEAILVMFKPSYLLNFSLFYLFTSPVVAIAGLFGTVYLIDKQKYIIVMLFVGFQIGWAVLVQQYLDFTYFDLNLIQSMMHDRYLFPMRFVTLGMVLVVIVPKLSRTNSWSTLHFYVIASWMLGMPFLFFSAQKADRTIVELRNTVIETREKKIPKSYYLADDYCDDIYIHRGSFFATFILSSIDGGEPCHVLHASEETIQGLDSINNTELLLMDGIIFSTKQLNKKRFRIDSGSYKPLNYSCNRNY